MMYIIHILPISFYRKIFFLEMRILWKWNGSRKLHKYWLEISPRKYVSFCLSGRFSFASAHASMIIANGALLMRHSAKKTQPRDNESNENFQMKQNRVEEIQQLEEFFSLQTNQPENNFISPFWDNLRFHIFNWANFKRVFLENDL